MDYNKCTFIGKVEEKPQARDAKGQKQVFFNLIVNDRVQKGDKWVDQPVTLPIFATDKKADIIDQYVVPGQEVLLECKYQAWKDASGNTRHVFTVFNVIFGFKPRQPDAAAPDIGAPPM
jgi:single-stranded DNA-binding protein